MKVGEDVWKFMQQHLGNVGCFDVGVQCGGWGHIDLELKMVDRK